MAPWVLTFARLIRTFCPCRCFRLPSLQPVRACTPHDAWKHSQNWFLSPQNPRRTGKLDKQCIPCLLDTIAQIFGHARLLREANRLLSILNAPEYIFLSFSSTFFEGNFFANKGGCLATL
jgi:hypothetical protein